MIIGITGSLAAGKGVVSKILKKRGFVYISLSNEIRQIAKNKGIELTRKNLQDLGNHLRETEGANYLAKIAVKKINEKEYTKVIIEGIRNPAEINELKKIKNFLLISIDAPKELRFKRIYERNRENDPKTFEEFLKVDDRDKGLGEKETGQEVAKCMSMADFILINDSSLEEIEDKIKNLLKI